MAGKSWALGNGSSGEEPPAQRRKFDQGQYGRQGFDRENRFSSREYQGFEMAGAEELENWDTRSQGWQEPPQQRGYGSAGMGPGHAAPPPRQQQQPPPQWRQPAPPQVGRMDEMEMVVADMARLLLTCNAAQKEMHGALTDTYLLSPQSPLIQNMIEAGQMYSAKCKGKRPDQHQMGGPVGYIVEACFKALLALPCRELYTEQVKTEIKDFYNNMETPQDFALEVPMMRQKSTRQQNIARMYVSFRSPSLQKAFRRAMVGTGAEFREGQAPMGQLERNLGNWVNGRG